jgi:hypothetical protein
MVFIFIQALQLEGVPKNYINIMVGPQECITNADAVSCANAVAYADAATYTNAVA